MKMHRDVKSMANFLKLYHSKLEEINADFVIARELANLYELKYSSFNRYQFIKACGVECAHTMPNAIGMCLVCGSGVPKKVRA